MIVNVANVKNTKIFISINVENKHITSGFKN